LGDDTQDQAELALAFRNKRPPEDFFVAEITLVYGRYNELDMLFFIHGVNLNQETSLGAHPAAG